MFWRSKHVPPLEKIHDQIRMIFLKTKQKLFPGTKKNKFLLQTLDIALMFYLAGLMALPQKAPEDFVVLWLKSALLWCNYVNIHLQ